MTTWFGHVQRRATNALVKESELIQVEGTKKSRGRPKRTLEVVKKDTSIIKEVTKTKSMTFDRMEWKKRINVADSY